MLTPEAATTSGNSTVIRHGLLTGKVLSGVGVEQRVDSLERELNEKHRATESSIKSDLSSIGQKLTELMGEVCQEGRVAIP